MRYRVELPRAPQRQLDKLVGRDYEAIGDAISSLEHNPRPRGVKKLAESGLWRLRVGCFRIVYGIDDKVRLVTIARIASRSEDTYRGL